MALPHSAPFTALLALGCAAACAHPPAGAVESARAFLPDAPLDVSIHDRASGRTLPLWRHRGEIYVAGEPGREYEIRLRGAAAGRVLAVTSVDGVNVLTGQSAAPDQPGYVIDGWSVGTIDGWRKSLDEVAAFVFTTPRRSYAARTGRPDDVGVIGVAMFRERESAYERERRLEMARAQAQADRRESAAAAVASRAAAAPAGASAGSTATAESADDATSSSAPALGTGHGRRHASQAERTEFERASTRPDAVVRIYYDSLRNLVARGVIPADPAPHAARRRPEPFPAGFVPDP